MTRTPKPKIDEIDDSNINEYIRTKIGMEPNAWGSRRRWHFLRIMTRHLFAVKRIDFDTFFVWTTAHCQCMKLRTLREDYLDTLERLDFIRIDWNSGTISWNGDNHTWSRK